MVWKPGYKFCCLHNSNCLLTPIHIPIKPSGSSHSIKHSYSFDGHMWDIRKTFVGCGIAVNCTILNWMMSGLQCMLGLMQCMCCCDNYQLLHRFHTSLWISSCLVEYFYIFVLTNLNWTVFQTWPLTFEIHLGAVPFISSVKNKRGNCSGQGKRIARWWNGRAFRSVLGREAVV